MSITLNKLLVLFFCCILSGKIFATSELDQQEDMKKSIDEVNQLSDDLDELYDYSNNKKPRKKPKKEIMDADYYKYFLGVGIGAGTASLGELLLVTDYNIRDKWMSQLHFALSYSRWHSDNSLGDEIIKISRFSTSFIYRKLFKMGWYFGTGLVYIDSLTQYNNPLPNSDNEAYTELKYYYSGLNGDFDFGWQSQGNFSIALGIRYGFNLWKEELVFNSDGKLDIDSSDMFTIVPEGYDHRDLVEKTYQKGISSTSLYLTISYFWNS